MLKRFNDLLEFIGASKKKELIKIIIINSLIIIGGVIVFIFLKQILIILAVIGLTAVVDYLLFNSYSNKKRLILNARENEFVTVINYFQLFLSNNINIYQCFKLIIPYTSEWMSEKLENLIAEIDEDKSVQPFVNYANNFSNKIANNVMISIYQMVDEGENKMHLMQFDVLFQQLSKNQQRESIEFKQRNMDSISTLPLIGAGAVTVLLTFGIISLMGEMINVI